MSALAKKLSPNWHFGLSAFRDRKLAKKSRKRLSRNVHGSLGDHYNLNKRKCFCNVVGQSDTPVIWREFLCNECLCDGIIVSIDNEEIPVHRALISGASVHFAKLFLCCKAKHIAKVAVNLTSRTIKQLLKFVYTQECDMEVNHLPSLLDAAYKFKFVGLYNLITTFLIENLMPENCLGTMRMMEPYLCREIKYKVFEYIVHNFEDVVKLSKDFNDLSSRALLEIISDDELMVESEEHLFNIVLQWIKHDSDQRVKNLPKLSKGIRYGLMNTTFLEQEVLNNVYIKNNEEILMELDLVCLFKNDEKPAFNLTFARPRIPKEIIFVIGGCVQGCQTNIIETYDIRANRWITADTVDPLVRAFYGVCNIGNLIYLVGGYDGVTVYTSMRCFNPVTTKWLVLSCMHQARCHNCAVALDGIVYTMGGFNGTHSLSSVEAYHPSTNQWSLLAPMNITRAECAAAALDGRVYVAGGSIGEVQQASVEVYNPTTNQWTYIQPMFHPRSGHNLVAYHGMLYALGGDDGEKKINTVEHIDPMQQDDWSSIEPMSIPRFNFAAVVADNKIYVVGGSSATSLNGSVECYDDVSRDWRRTAHSCLRRSAIGACVLTHLPNVREYCYLKLLEADAESSSSSEQEEGTDDDQSSNKL